MDALVEKLLKFGCHHRLAMTCLPLMNMVALLATGSDPLKTLLTWPVFSLPWWLIFTDKTQSDTPN
jgi:hypothetical protein